MKPLNQSPFHTHHATWQLSLRETTVVAYLYATSEAGTLVLVLDKGLMPLSVECVFRRCGPQQSPELATLDLLCMADALGVICKRLANAQLPTTHIQCPLPTLNCDANCAENGALTGNGGKVAPPQAPAFAGNVAGKSTPK